MDRRSWLWRRKSSEKSPGETESSGSVSSHSERYSDDQEALRASPNSNSPNHAQSPEISSNVGSNEVNETIKSLTEKLSVALLNINAKEDLVKQHSKVAEEAVSGWEKAETEVALLKQQLETTSQKNSALEDRISHLDGALKECVRQLRQSREEQEQKVHDALVKKVREWESEKVELENQLSELKEQLESTKAELPTSVDNDLQEKLETTEKENAALRAELLAQSEELQLRMLERELSTRTAETASKHHLESIKKVAKLEAECRRFRALARRTSSANDKKTVPNSVCMESLTDSQSDSGERLLGADNALSCSDSWASALIAELDQFKSEKPSARNLATSIDINLMDDFLEMERLVSLPETDNASSSFNLETDSNQVTTTENPSKVELEALHRKMAELEGKVRNMETEKAQLEKALAGARDQLQISCNQLAVAEDKLVEMHKQLNSANESKQVSLLELAGSEEKRKALESKLKSSQLEVGKLHDKIALLEGKLEESAFSTELKLEVLESTRKELESQLHAAHLEAGKLRMEVGMLEGKMEEEKALSAEFAAKSGTVETRMKELESQLSVANLELRRLQEKVGLLEQRIEEEKSLSMDFAAKVDAVEAARKALEFQLELAHLEVGKLCDEVSLLEGKVDDERASSAQLAAKCENLEDKLSRELQGAELQRLSSSNGGVKLKQEKELAVAAGKLAECQKTIASLGQQLKSLATIDDFMFDPEKPELNGGSPVKVGDTKSSALSNGKDRGSPPSSSSSSTLAGSERLLSWSRKTSHIES